MLSVLKWTGGGLLLLLVIGAVLILARHAYNVRLMYKQTPPSETFVTVDGVKLYYKIDGAGQNTGPTVILIHGAGGNLREMTFSLSGKLAARYQVVSFDRPGHGYSDRIPTRNGLGESPQEQAALFAKASRALGIEEAVIVGHSYGGAVALAWALAEPKQVQAVVSLAGVSNEWDGDLAAWYRQTTTFFGRFFFLPVLTAIASENRVRNSASGIFAPDPMPDGYLEHVGIALSKSLGTQLATTQQVGTLKPHIIEMEARYGELAMPIEILFGDQDTSVPVTTHGDVFITQVPSANLTTLPGVGHMPHHARETEAIAAIDRAVNRATNQATNQTGLTANSQP